MRRNELLDLILKNGFYLKRNGRHAIYHDGRTRLVVPRGGTIDYRLSKSIRLEIKRAVLMRGSSNCRSSGTAICSKPLSQFRKGNANGER